MGKSSSSSRRKNRSKASSKVRKRKGSKISSRKRESKKLRRHILDADHSRSSTSGSYSYSSSSSEDDKYRSRSSRIRTRKDVKSSKRWAKKRSYTSESSESPPRVRKRKGSKRKRDHESKRKIQSKKKHRRDYSTSSASSGSSSCSKCQGDGSHSHEVEFERRWSKRGLEERDERLRDEVESPSKRSRYRSRSPSHSRFSESSSYQSEEKVSVENDSRRLRSVIIVAKRDTEEETELSKDEDKEEIIYVHGDYPPCRSNDSNDVGSKWGEGDHSPNDEVEKMRLENEKGDETALWDLTSNKHAKSGNVCKTDEGSQFDGSNPSFDECGTVNTVNDLESVLRQKALENLRRFRGGLQTAGRTTGNRKGKSEGDVQESSIPNAEAVHTKSNLEYDTRVVGAKFLQEDGAEVFVSTETQQGKAVRVPISGKATTSSSQITHANEAVSAKHNVAHLTLQTTIAENSKEKVSAGISVVQPKLATPASMHQLSKIRSTPMQVIGPKEPRENLLLTKSSSDETAAVTAPPVTQNGNNNGADVNNACSSNASEPSLLKSASVETSSDKLQDEAHEGSQFEEKTMSVMRGGEMVKVSYKVYIPKKAPALARRQLKR